MGGRDELERLFEPRTGDGVRRRRTHAVTADARRPPVLSPSEAVARPPQPPSPAAQAGTAAADGRRGPTTAPRGGTGEVPGTPTPVKRDRENRSLHRLSTAAAPFRGATPLTAAVRIRSAFHDGRAPASYASRHRSPPSREARANDAVDTVMILPQVHLRKPCYDFYFL